VFGIFSLARDNSGFEKKQNSLQYSGNMHAFWDLLLCFATVRMPENFKIILGRELLR
jgi:hypothetical protein